MNKLKSPHHLSKMNLPKIGSILVIALFVLSIGILSPVQQTNAASLSNWDAGRIIDDEVMVNKNTMTVSQIQSFLNSKVTACDTNGQQLSEYGGPDLNGDGKVQRWEWGKANYNQTTFPCLKDYKDPSTGLSSAQTIYNSAQKYAINPQVLIVLLQKEQGLVTDTWPLNVQYRSATGYGCPDTAACDSKYYGLTNQLNWSSTMFRAIIDNSPTWYTPYVLGNNYIQYNPVSSCGGSTVNIQNRSTQALYNYTPYQPNKAALDAGYGGGDSCSAHGNRNFYLYFTDWFGSTMGTPFFKIKNDDHVYMLGANNNYYVVLSLNDMYSYGWTTKVTRVVTYTSSYTSGLTYSGALPVIARFEGSEIYLLDKGVLHQLASQTQMATLGYKVGDEAQLQATSLQYYPKGSAMQTVLRDESRGHIYLMESGKKRHFTGPSAYKSGSPAYSSLPLINLSSAYIDRLKYGAPIYRPATMVRVGDTSPVYLINDINKKIYISSPDTMNSYGFSFKNVLSVNQLQADAYPKDSINLSVFTKDTAGSIFFSDKGVIHPVDNTVAGSSYYNIDQATMNVIDKSIINSKLTTTPLTELIRADNDTKVYIVENGVKRHVKSPSELYSMGYTFDDVTDVSLQFLNTIP